MIAEIIWPSQLLRKVLRTKFSIKPRARAQLAAMQLPWTSGITEDNPSYTPALC
jgi:hypothetical protein